MSKTNTIEFTLLDLLAVKQGQAPKLSAGAEGKITYQVALSTDKKSIYLALEDSGSQGYFSREWINAAAILDILEPLMQRADAFTSKAFQPVFVGRSSNNAPFLAAVLLAEGLLGRDKERETKLNVAGDFDTWRKNILSLKGKSIRVRSDGKPITSESIEQANNKARKTVAASKQMEQSEEAEHAADSSN